MVLFDIIIVRFVIVSLFRVTISILIQIFEDEKFIDFQKITWIYKPSIV
jgi:hypothetical protein